MEENKYQQGKIYKIIDNGYNMCYYGSTIRLLCQRMGHHRGRYKKNILSCSLKDIFDKYGVENCKIELVENYPCNNREELEAREGYYIKNNDCINKRIAGRSKKQHYEANKEKILEQNRQYKEANKEILKEKNILYRQKRTIYTKNNYINS